jgi:predicted MPP superfamily phosphohydrolase
VWPGRVEITHHDVLLEGLPPALDGCRVVQLTDLHAGFFFRAGSARHAVSLCNALEPQLVVLTGDFVSTRSMKHLAPAAQELTGLTSRFGVFACLGNHVDWEGAEAVRGALEDVGVRVLSNECLELTEGLWLAAVDDLMSGEPDLDRATAGLPAGSAVILLSHNPTILPQVADRPWLVLSGHTHGCQMVLPFLGPRGTARLPGVGRLMWAYEALGTRARGGRLEAVCGHRHPAGWYEEGRARLYVNRGIGVNEAFPVRVGCPAEIACFTLRTAEAAQGERGREAY